MGKIGIRSYSNYQNLRDVGSYFTKQEALTDLELAFADEMHGWFASLGEDARKGEGLHLLLNGDHENISQNHRKKIALFSKISLLRTESISSPEWNRGQGLDSLTYVAGPDLGACLRLAYKYKKDVSSGLLLPVPEDITIIDEEMLAKVHEQFLIKNDGLDHKTLSRKVDQLFEEDVEQSSRCIGLPEGALVVNLQDLSSLDKLRLGVLLPSLDRVPLQDVQRLRRDFGDEFEKFQKALLGFAQESEACEDPDRFGEIIEKVEYAVSDLVKSIARMRRSHPKTMASLVGSVVGLIYVFSVPDSAISHALVAALTGSLSYLMLLAPVRDERLPVAQSPFYFPLRLMEAAKKMKG